MSTPDDPYATPAPGAEPPSTPGYPPPGGQPGYGPPTYGQAPYGPQTYGQAPYGPPTYGPPTYGQAPPAASYAFTQPPYGYAPTRPGTNGLAIASLVCGLAGIVSCGISSIVGFILGFVALSKMKKEPQQGRGLAIAGIVVSGIVSLITIVTIAVVVGFAASQVSKCNDGTYTGQDYEDHCTGSSGGTDVDF